ncbi:integral membrane protein GPR137B-like [Actinia tenebrosa]|uniref:Integral membrane protein GPR137B-like n=1 Tax=Actinia tenebrosa TaxID=6105 RepID=A0A6P8HT10_ACTTE|nr:integral membrane protein GPR137B-like [Actinia tenebrosa]
MINVLKSLLSLPRVHPTTIPATNVEPPLPVGVLLIVTIVFMSIYAILFIFTISQLVLILVYKHRRLSYQTFFLFTCLIWAGIRTTLFSFYFSDCKVVNNLQAFPRWFLFAFPIYLQFVMLGLLTLYLVKLLVKSGRTSIEPAKHKNVPNIVFVICNVIFLALNISSSILCPEQSYTQKLVIVRVVVNELLFILVGILLCISMRKLTKTPNSNLFLEGQGTTTCQATAICIIVVLLYMSRAVYNMIAVTVQHDLSNFGFGWINVSDEGEIEHNHKLQMNVNNHRFLSFGIVLIVWEVLPTFMVIWFFRVRRPQAANLLQGPSIIASNSFDQRSYFFDNPRRYDSDEDIHTAGSGKSNYDIPGVLSPSSNSNSINTGHPKSYGSIPVSKSGSFNRSSSYPSAYIPGTTPPMLFTSGNQGGYQRSQLEPVKDKD